VRISTQENREQITFKVEGRIVGDWATELERFWKSLEPSLDAKKLCLDISGVTYIDALGKKILREIFASTGAEILADSPLTKQFANEARRNGSLRRKTGEGHA
jgi:anti-anti-sigma regulatory factor